MTHPPRPLSHPIAAICIALAALCIQRAATLVWGGATAPDGSRYKVSPIGLSKRLQTGPADATDPQCRWWPPGAGDAGLCATAPNGDKAYRQLRSAYPLLSVALWTAVAALFLQVLRVPRAPAARLAVTWAVPMLTTLAIAVVVFSAAPALAVLAGLEVRFGSLGFTLALFAALFSAASGVLLLTRKP